MPPTNTDVLLRLLLQDKFTGEMDKALAHFEERIKKASSVKELESIERQFKEITQAVNETTKAASVQARALRLLAAERKSDLRDLQTSLLGKAAGGLQGISTKALLGGIAIPTGIFAEVQRYVNSAEEATDVTRAWKAETDKLAKSRTRIDEVLTREALPALRVAARLANEAAGFVEQHPEIVQAALKAGVILVALGALGTIAAKGIKLVADAAYLATIPAQLTAAKLQDKAADTQLKAALLRAKDLGLPLQEGKGGLSTGQVGLAGVGVLATAAVTTVLAKQLNAIEDLLVKKFGGIGSALVNVIATPLGFIAPLLPGIKSLDRTLPGIKEFVKNILNFGDAVEDASQKANNAITRLAGSENEGAVVSAFTKWKEDDRRLIEEAAENRRKIIGDSERAIANATRQFAQRTVDINKQFDKARADLIRDFAESSKQAEIDYARSRADIVKDAGEEVRRIEEQHQENIRQMTLEHNQRREDLTASRDALGLAKEQQRFDQELAETERGVNREIAERRRETGIRLQQLAVEFAAERAQRQAQFEQALAENHARRQEELQEAAAAHAEELRQIREQRAAQLRELQQNLNAERLRRREVFIAEVRDLDAALLGERNLKVRYYNLMLADAEKWLAAYRAKLSAGTASATGSKALGGYATYGLYRLGDTPTGGRGGAEFVMNANTTRAAEQVIGGQLSQRAILNAMMMGRGSQITLNDHRRFDSRLSLADRRAIQEDTMQVLSQVLG